MGNEAAAELRDIALADPKISAGLFEQGPNKDLSYLPPKMRAIMEARRGRKSGKEVKVEDMTTEPETFHWKGFGSPKDEQGDYAVTVQAGVQNKPNMAVERVRPFLYVSFKTPNFTTPSVAEHREFLVNFYRDQGFGEKMVQERADAEAEVDVKRIKHAIMRDPMFGSKIVAVGACAKEIAAAEAQTGLDLVKKRFGIDVLDLAKRAGVSVDMQFGSDPVAPEGAPVSPRTQPPQPTVAKVGVVPKPTRTVEVPNRG